MEPDSGLSSSWNETAWQGDAGCGELDWAEAAYGFDESWWQGEPGDDGWHEDWY